MNLTACANEVKQISAMEQTMTGRNCLGQHVINENDGYESQPPSVCGITQDGS